jgi:class 3 adenylate cyclase/tetratricopeptide (TPR) repeat protein
MVTCPSCRAQVPERFRRCGHCGTELTTGHADQEIRRLVTVVTSDLKGSTALGEKLDPESLREVLTRYFDEMRAVFESHGGTIEKIIGDAIVAVFGLPTRRPDDAYRAAAAAAETQRALASLNDQLDETWGVRLTVRTGVATGEVIVGEVSAGAHVLTGETMRVATVMEQNAPSFEVLLAASTLEALGELVAVEAFGPVTAKGGGEPVEAFRLVSVSEAAESTAGSGPPGDQRLCTTCGEENPREFRHCGTCGATLAERAVAKESRKTVSIVFADPKPAGTDGTQISAEALRDVMSRYFAEMQRVLERHGATVEKFIGDAVMAVFGLPIRHEDDALRAVRAASDMQAALPALNDAFAADWGVRLGNHIGVNTGEVVAGDASLGQRLVTGDTVNVAARLEQAAGPGEVLLGDLTYRLVRGAVEVEAVEPLTLKGKAEPVPAHRLLVVKQATEGLTRRQDAPMVGREAETAALEGIFQRSTQERACRLATVIADAGVGKSRLVREFTAARAAEATVIRGRCLPYGDGITFWPLAEAAREAAAIEPDDSPFRAMQRLEAVAGDGQVARRIASVMGISKNLYPVAEIFWAARKFLEALGRTRPVVMVVEDIHWAESTFLDLIGNLVETISDASVLLLCTSRPDLLEREAEWSTSEHALRLSLGPLDETDAGRVVQGLLGDAGIEGAVQARIVQAAAGNPLFVEQLLSMLIDDGSLRQVDGRWRATGDLSSLSVPPTINALLAARLDLLGGNERSVIEPASVIGQSFAEAAVGELAPEPVKPMVHDSLGTLTGKQLLTANPAAGVEDLGFRFPNILIRDAAYNGLLKRSRAVFHERFVAWADEINRRQGREQEFEEILGYHLEQAYRYLSELGTLDAHARALGAAASDRLANAGRRAMARGDMPAAAGLLRRAAATRASADPLRLSLLPELGEALGELGEFEEAEGVLADALARVGAVTEDPLAAKAALTLLLVRLYSGSEEDWSAAATTAVAQTLPTFERAGDHRGQALANRLLVFVHGSANRWGLTTAAAQQVMEHARAVDDVRLERRGALGYAQCLLFGPTPAAEAIHRCEELIADSAGDRRAQSLIRNWLAQLYAMVGEIERARQTFADASAALLDLGGGLAASQTSIALAQIELIGGDLDVAEMALRRDHDQLSAMGERFLLPTVIGLLARVVSLQGRHAEAEQFARTTQELATDDDVDSQVNWRGLLAVSLAARGETAEAERLAREAVDLASTSDAPQLQADAHAWLGEVLLRSNHGADWRGLLDEAIRLYAAKGDVVSAARVTALRNDNARA